MAALPRLSRFCFHGINRIFLAKENVFLSRKFHDLSEAGFIRSTIDRDSEEFQVRMKWVVVVIF